MVEKVWGSAGQVPFNAKRVKVDNGAEIAKNNWAYVDFIPQNTVYSIPISAYWQVVNGDLTYIKNMIEQGISGAQCQWIRISWSHSSIGGLGGNFEDFRVEALVRNINAGLTGLEIAAIVLAVGFLIAIVTAAVLVLYSTYEVFSALDDLEEDFGAWGSVATVAVGLLLIAGAGVFLFFMFGGSFSKGKKGFKVQGRRG